MLNFYLFFHLFHQISQSDLSQSLEMGLLRKVFGWNSKDLIHKSKRLLKRYGQKSCRPNFKNIELNNYQKIKYNFEYFKHSFTFLKPNSTINERLFVSRSGLD